MEGENTVNVKGGTISLQKSMHIEMVDIMCPESYRMYGPNHTKLNVQRAYPYPLNRYVCLVGESPNLTIVKMYTYVVIIRIITTYNRNFSVTVDMYVRISSSLSYSLLEKWFIQVT